MRSTDCVDRTGADTGTASVIVTCVHGTWARGSRWPELETTITNALGDCGLIAFRYFEWSGRNSVKARTQAASDLRQFLLHEISRTPLARHVLVAHSHGATIVLRALTPNLKANLNTNQEARTAKCEQQVAAVVLLSPPLLDCEIVEQPEGAANKLLLAAVAVVPLLLAASRYARVTFGISRTTQLIGLLAVLVPWLLMFRPAAVRRRAEVLARQLTLPRLDFPGLVVRTERDEATVTLSSVSAFARLARQVWSRVLEAPAAFWRKDEQQLRDARRPTELASAVFNALILLPMSLTLLSSAHAAANDEQWMTLAISLPFGVALATAGTVIVGGSFVLLLLLPAFSILLWPFGVRPTIASALLDVSVEQVPTPRWQMVSLERRHIAGWRHSLHEQPEALECVRDYLRGVLARVPHVDCDGHPSLR